jgi:hypothetical protein
LLAKARQLEFVDRDTALKKQLDFAIGSQNRAVNGLASFLGGADCLAELF